MSENLLPILSSPMPEAILSAFLPKLRAFLGRRISNQADVDDLAQEILLRVHQGARHLSTKPASTHGFGRSPGMRSSTTTERGMFKRSRPNSLMSFPTSRTVRAWMPWWVAEHFHAASVRLLGASLLCQLTRGRG